MGNVKLNPEVLPGPGQNIINTLLAIERDLRRLGPLASPPFGFRAVSLASSLTTALTTTDHTLVVTATTAGSNVVFLAARTAGTKIVVIANKTGNAITLKPAGGDTIDVTTVPANSNYWYHSDGVSKWWKIN